MSGELEDRLTQALDGRPAGDDPELAELLETAGYLRESLVGVPAPADFRHELGDWLAQPRPLAWWRRARRPAMGAAIGIGAAAVVFGVVALRRRLVASASS